MSDCIFCRIAAGEIPASVVFEDEHVVAFDDVAPQAPVHVLIVPRVHYASLEDTVPADVAAALVAAVPRVAAARGLSETGYRVVINTGPDARQTVQHLHVHVMGGKPMTHGMVRFGEGE
jgi:histidine triad (HIT) family protein